MKLIFYGTPQSPWSSIFNITGHNNFTDLDALGIGDK